MGGSGQPLPTGRDSPDPPIFTETHISGKVPGLGGLDDEDYDFYAACDLQAEGSGCDGGLGEPGDPESACSGNPSIHVPRVDCIPAGQHAVLRLPLLPDGVVLIGGGRVSTTHALRFTGQYVWCSCCGAFCSGKEAKLLGQPCHGAPGSRAYALGRLSRGLTPRPNSAPLVHTGTGRVRICGAQALQLPD